MANSATYNRTKVHFAEGSAAATPDSGEVVIYAKADGRMYLKDDTGAEVLMGSAGGTGLVTPINFLIDGGGSTITTGIKGVVRVPFAWTDIVAATAIGDQSGSIVVDVWKGTTSEAIAGTIVNGDSITASAPITVSSAIGSTDATLTGWTQTGSAGDVLMFNVDSVTSMQRVTLAIDLVRA